MLPESFDSSLLFVSPLRVIYNIARHESSLESLIVFYGKDAMQAKVYFSLVYRTFSFLRMVPTLGIQNKGISS